MAERGTPTLAPPANGNVARSAPASRSVSRRRTLPGSRAVVGGLLVTASAVGLFAAYSNATEGPTDNYVVMAREVLAGEMFTAEDLDLVPIELPPAQRGVSFTDPGILVGKVATGRLGKGQLVQSTLVARPTEANLARVSVPVDPANAMNGKDLLGTFVDVIVTVTESGTPQTSTVAQRVQVVDVISGDQSLGNSGELTVVLAVDPNELEPIARAAATGTITIARTGLR